jgi:membrane associated rhomboid family serine protease
MCGGEVKIVGAIFLFPLPSFLPTCDSALTTIDNSMPHVMMRGSAALFATCMLAEAAHCSSAFVGTVVVHPRTLTTPFANQPLHTSSSQSMPINNRHPKHQTVPYRHIQRYIGIRRQHNLLYSRPRRRDQNDNDDDEDDTSNTNSHGEDDDIVDGFIRGNDNIDFTKYNDKVFDDTKDYGWIRSIETPFEDTEEPLSVDEIELWMEKKKLQQKKQSKKVMWKRMFPWVSPLTSLLIPKRHAASKSSRSFEGSANKSVLSGPNSVRNLLVSINVAAFIYQIATVVKYLPGFNRVLAMSVAGDAVSAAALDGVPQWTATEAVLRALGFVGAGTGIVIKSGVPVQLGGAVGRHALGMSGPIAAHSMGPFFLDFAHQPFPFSYFQKHRFLTGGFLHGSLLHLIMNLRALLSLPPWLENGIGKGVYTAAYLVAVVTGNIAQTLSTLGDGRAASALCVGASGGICGLYGLMFASLLKMGNSSAAIIVFKQMLWLIAFGYMVPNVSNAGHVGGFVGGWLIGMLFGPGYGRSYSLSKGGTDRADTEFRRMMGTGIYPSADKAIFPLKYLWMGVGALLLSKPELRLIPSAIVKGIVEPGSLSGVRLLLT